MPAPKKLVYLIMILRIYESGGACADSIGGIATRVGFNKRIVSEALNELFNEGRLFRGEGGIRNPKADAIIEDSMALRERRQSSTSKAGLASAEKRKKKQSKSPTSRSTDVERNPTHLQLQEQQESLSFLTERESSDSKPVSEWPGDYRERFWIMYPRREGKKAAISKLDTLRKSGKISWDVFAAGLNRYVKHTAGTEQRFIKQPVTWLNQGCWDDEFKNEGEKINAETRNDRIFSKTGFAGVSVRVRQARALRDAADSTTWDHASDQQHGNRRQAEPPALERLEGNGEASPSSPSSNR
jgi:hypothetical protein